MEILIKNAEIITMNEKSEILHGDLLIRDDRIVAIEDKIENVTPDKMIDATGKTVIPGLIQSHIHLCQTLFRGRGRRETSQGFHIPGI